MVFYLLLGLVMYLPFSYAFAFPHGVCNHRLGGLDTRVLASKESVETEVERLLRKARELREEAARSEEQVTDDLLSKSKDKDSQTDRIIQELFSPTDHDTSFVDRLRGKHCCMDTLETLLVRLDEREQTDSSMNGFVEQFIEACSVLDEEFRQKMQDKGESYVSHAEREHWGGGTSATQLQAHWGEIQRERSEGFQRRIEDLREAQRLKDDDEHKFHGYKTMDKWDPDDKHGF